MYISFDPPNKDSRNSEGPEQIINYLLKEDKEKKRVENDVEKGFFSSEEKNLTKEEARTLLEHSKYRTRLGKDEAKFFSISINFSQEELKNLSNEEIITFVQNQFSPSYSESILGREVDPKNIVWFAKIEEDRRYKGDSPEVLNGEARSGELKPGDNRHVHVVVARKTLCDKKVSPLSNHFRVDVNKGSVKGGFDQDIFKIDLERRFDKDFSFERAYSNSYQIHLDGKRSDLKKELDFKKIIEKEVKKSKDFFPLEKQRAFLSATLKRAIWKAGSLEQLQEILREKGVELSLVGGGDQKRFEIKSLTASNSHTFSVKDLGFNDKLIERLHEQEVVKTNSREVGNLPNARSIEFDQDHAIIDSRTIDNDDDNFIKRKFKKKQKGKGK